MKKELKKQIVEELSKESTNEVSVFYADFKGQTVKDLEALRSAVRVADGKARIIKNTLARLAFANNNIEASFEENNIFVWGEDSVATSKVVADYAKKNKTFVIKSAYIDREAADAAKVEAFAKLPGREELLGMLAAVWMAPVRNWTIGLNALKEKKENPDSAE